ncbi:MAG: response regulator [Lachnospiraceae bacterium]|nr:response regulator [Lachnospiraceae bacterium]
MRIMIVDDEPFIREGFKKLLEMADADLSVAAELGNGREALEYLEKNKVDLIFADIKMPGMTGLEMVEKIREKKLSDAEIVILTGFADFEYARRAMKLGIRDYLLKPVQLNELKKLLREISDGKSEIKNTGEARESIFNLNIRQKDVDLLTDAIRKNDAELIKKYASIIFRELRSDGVNAEMVNAVIYHILFCLLELAREFDNEPEEAELMQYIDREPFEEMIAEGDDNDISDFLLDYADFLEEARNQERRGIIEDVDDYVEGHYRENLSLKELSQKFYVNKVYLGQLFKKKHGMLFKDYITLLRVNDAEKMLTETDLRVYAIAEELGFSNADSLIGKFLQLKGVTPNQYRIRSRMRNGN